MAGPAIKEWEQHFYAEMYEETNNYTPEYWYHHLGTTTDEVYSIRYKKLKKCHMNQDKYLGWSSDNIVLWGFIIDWREPEHPMPLENSQLHYGLYHYFCPKHRYKIYSILNSIKPRNFLA